MMLPEVMSMEEKTVFSKRIFEENELEANRYACRCLQVMAIIVLLAWLMNLLNIFSQTYAQAAGTAGGGFLCPATH